ncbi:MAG: hypothetical protein JWR65_3647 [Massilia sp.]|jgi:hypothetical protein|nr:hypothetical protein [Massilia sp.]
MNPLLGLRTLALLALVAASTIVIVRPDLIAGAARAPLAAPVITNLLVAGGVTAPTQPESQPDPQPLQKHPEIHHGQT